MNSTAQNLVNFKISLASPSTENLDSVLFNPTIPPAARNTGMYDNYSDAEFRTGKVLQYNVGSTLLFASADFSATSLRHIVGHPIKLMMCDVMLRMLRELLIHSRPIIPIVVAVKPT